MIKRTLGLLALAAAATATLGGNAVASYDYSTALSIVSAPGATITNTATGATAVFGGTTVSLSNVGRTGLGVPSDNTVNVGDIRVTTSTAPPSSDSFTINYLDLVTVTNNPPPGTSGTLTVPVTGTLTITQVNTGTGTITNIYTSASGQSATVGGVTFTGFSSNFGNPTINGAKGNLGGRITAAVPEPSSVALMGVGVVAAIGLAARRRMLSNRIA